MIKKNIIMEIPSIGLHNLFFYSSSSGLRDRWYGSSLRRTLKVIQLSAGESESDPQRPPAGTKERKSLEMLFVSILSPSLLGLVY